MFKPTADYILEKVYSLQNLCLSVCIFSLHKELVYEFPPVELFVFLLYWMDFLSLKIIDTKRILGA